MRRLFLPGLAFLFFISAPPARAEVTPSADQDSMALIEKIGISNSAEPFPGVKLAEGVSQLTGVAISPLLGVSVVGAWNYFRTEEASRGKLPWICHPAAWLTGLSVLLLCFFKDSFGNLLPAFAKKPLDLIELFEDKLSAIVASVGFIPFLIRQYSANQLSSAEAVAFPPVPDTQLAAATPGFIALIEPAWFLLPLAFAGFLVVWIVSHAITVLATLSPSRIFSTILKLARLALLGLIGLLYLVSPVIAALLAVLLITTCCFLAPRAFRFSVFGTVVSADFFHSLIWKKPFDPGKLRYFLARRGNERMKVRSFGRLFLFGDRVAFQRRRFFIGPEQQLLLPSTHRLVITKGFPFPVIQMRNDDDTSWVTIIHLLPRFRHSLNELSEHLEIPTQDHPAIRGLKASASWCREAFTTKSQAQIEA
ncbi:MAG: hypothetical protein P1U68_18175 [Verrucomicrobiales bacterium]|nr:hypothetical protein [Verrucomicrobiales bacterium]